jgi:hypothetical protein
LPLSRSLLVALITQTFHDPRPAVDEVPAKHYHPNDDRDIEIPQQSPDIRPVRPERDARVREGKAERKRPQHRVKGESFYVHPDDAGGIGDYRADDRKQPTDEDGTFPVLCKPLLATVKLALAYEHVFAVAFEQRPTAVRADSVGNEGAGEAAERTGKGDAEKGKFPFPDHIPGEAHDDLARQRQAGTLKRHPDENARIAEVLDDGDDEVAERLNDINA